MQYERFFAANALSGVIWGTAHVGIGYLVGPSYETVDRYLGVAGWVALAVVAAVAAGLWWRHRRRGSRVEKNEADMPPDIAASPGATDEPAMEPNDSKQRVLNKTRSAVTTAVSTALVIKSDRVFFLCRQDGSVPDEEGHGFGLYYDDTRFMRAYAFTLCGQSLDALSADDGAGDSVYHVLANPDMHDAAGKMVPKESIGITLNRVLSGVERRLDDRFQFDNYSLDAVELPFDIDVGPDFASVFDVRGIVGERPGELGAPRVRKDRIEWVYRGVDARTRRLGVSFDPKPNNIDARGAHFVVKLDGRASQTLQIVVDLAVDDEDSDASTRGHDSTSHDPDTYLRDRTKVITADPAMQLVIDCCFRDLRMLQTHLEGETFFAAGVPWYATIFGRDSLVTALQTLAYNPQIAEQTMALMAKYQGTKHVDWTEEQPGRILHELRRDELTNIGELPYTPYYGTVDATPLFLLLCARHAQWTGRLDVFERFRENIDAALRWVDELGDSDGDGYLDYAVKTSAGLINEAWKDSSDAMVTAAGALAEAPVAVAEVQAYVFAAKTELAELYERCGDVDTAKRLREEADDLRQRFNRDYWVDDIGTFAMGLERDMRPLAVVSSNAGQVLWTGIADDDHAHATADRLMQDDMFSGWGIRTISTTARRFNPVAYHLGSVWPHDNSIVFAGMRRVGRDDAVCVFQAMLEAAGFFPSCRLPELFAGFDRQRFPRPVHYPVACHPQAWAAGAIPFMLQSALGIRPAAFEHRLVVERPVLPAALGVVQLEDLKVGDGVCHLRFERRADGTAVVTVIDAHDVTVDVRA
jgi:glycogen debranching enzyme